MLILNYLSLNLSYNQIYTKGCYYLSFALRKLSNLTFFNLEVYKNKITDN